MKSSLLWWTNLTRSSKRQIFLLFVALVLLAECIIVVLALWHHADRKDVLQTVAAFWGGTVVASGLYLTVQTISVTQEGQITGRFTAAIEQLAHDNITVRTGGIYSLERIANDSDRDFRTVMDVLAFFVRKHAARSEIDNQATDLPPTMLPADIQACLTVIGRRRIKNSTSGAIDLSNTDLRNARLLGLNFDGVNFEGAILSNADMRDTSLQKTNFSSAIMIGTRIHPSRFKD